MFGLNRPKGIYDYENVFGYGVDPQEVGTASPDLGSYGVSGSGGYQVDNSRLPGPRNGFLDGLLSRMGPSNPPPPGGGGGQQQQINPMSLMNMLQGTSASATDRAAVPVGMPWQDERIMGLMNFMRGG